MTDTRDFEPMWSVMYQWRRRQTSTSVQACSDLAHARRVIVVIVHIGLEGVLVVMYFCVAICSWIAVSGGVLFTFSKHCGLWPSRVSHSVLEVGTSRVSNVSCLDHFTSATEALWSLFESWKWGGLIGPSVHHRWLPWFATQLRYHVSVLCTFAPFPGCLVATRSQLVSVTCVACACSRGWATHGLLTAVSTGVPWVLTGTHPCAPDAQTVLTSVAELQLVLCWVVLRCGVLWCVVHVVVWIVSFSRVVLYPLARQHGFIHFHPLLQEEKKTTPPPKKPKKLTQKKNTPRKKHPPPPPRRNTPPHKKKHPLQKKKHPLQKKTPSPKKNTPKKTPPKKHPPQKKTQKKKTSKKNAKKKNLKTLPVKKTPSPKKNAKKKPQNPPK